jgi:carboxymethylenebutenolidase
MADGDMTTAHVAIQSASGDKIDGYYARPDGEGPFPGIVVVQHIFGVDEWIMEVCRRFAHHGYMAVAPNLYSRIGSLGSGPVEDLAATLRARGGLNDDVVLQDLQGSADLLRGLPDCSGKVGLIGFCLGGRLAYLAACRLPTLDAAVDCWGGGVAPDPQQPGNPPGVPPIDFTNGMQVPLLGIFGNDDQRPDPSEVDRTEATLKTLGKAYEFHRYDGAGHGFFNWTNVAYRQQQATDGWGKVWDFFDRYLSLPAATGSRAN